MSVFQQFFGSATPIVNQTNAGSNSLVSQIASGGGGGGSNYPANIVASTITALTGSIGAMTISSINGQSPGGAIPTAGISTNQVSAVGTDLFLSADGENYIDITGSSGGAQITMTVPAGNLVIESQSTITLNSFYSASNITTPALTVSSINGVQPGGSAPLVSTYSYTTGLTILPNIPDLLFNSGPAPFTLTSGHKYTASWNIAYKNEGAGATPTMALKLDLGNNQGGDPGSIYSAPAYMTNANSLDGALDLFSMTWKQGGTDASTNLYVTLVDSAPLVNVSTTITNVGGSQYFTLTDWGIVS